MSSRLRIAVVGCGQISRAYGLHISNYPELLEIAGGMDIAPTMAAEFCAEYGGKVYPDLEAVLADPAVDVVLNLTVHTMHFEINARALRAGKHVFSEKPMALTVAEARELAAISLETGCLLAAAPITYMGEGIQTASQFLETGLIGPLRLVYAEVNWGQIERWVRNPAPYFGVGPLLDVGVYAITALTMLLGPVRRVWGYSTILKTPRQDKKGKEFPVTAPDFTTGMLEFETGVVARLTTNYFVQTATQEHLKGFEFHGDDGSFSISCFHEFNPKCRYIPYKKQAVEIPLLREAGTNMDRGLGLAELALAIREKRPLRNSPEHATHVIEVMEGLQLSADRGGMIDITSSFPKPELMDWTKEATLQLPITDPLIKPD